MILLIPVFVVWGWLLSIIGYRLVGSIPFFSSTLYCPLCKSSLAWYDVIPLISYITLKGKCRTCNGTISYLYPTIELLTLCSFFALFWYIPYQYLFAYSLFFSSLIICIYTDAQTMLLSRFTTIWFAPIGIVLSYYGCLPISTTQSIVGALSAYCFLYAVAKSYELLRKHPGMGLGDVELLTLIGAFVGFYGWWFTLLIASLLGSFVGLLGVYFSRTSITSYKIPFGPFLSLAAMLFVFLQNFLYILVLQV